MNLEKTQLPSSSSPFAGLSNRQEFNDARTIRVSAYRAAVVGLTVVITELVVLDGSRYILYQLPGSGEVEVC